MSHNVSLWIGAHLVTALVATIMLVWSLHWFWRQRALLQPTADQPPLTGLALGMARRNMRVALTQALTTSLILMVAVAMLTITWVRQTQRLADYAANLAAALAVIWTQQCVGMWWDRRLLQALRPDQRAGLRVVEREERTG